MGFAMRQADDESIELPSTSHFNIVDKAGNVISMTTTIENGFGSRLMANGFLLNNELTDFFFQPKKMAILSPIELSQASVRARQCRRPL